MIPFFHLLFPLSLLVTFIFVFGNSQYSFPCGSPFGPFWSVKYFNFWKKVPIRTAHLTFPESRHPEVTKNSNYDLSPEVRQKRYHLMDYLGNNMFQPVVTKFTYLGKNLNTDCRDNEDVVFRFKKPGNASGALSKCLFLNSNISVVAKRAVYEGLILPILLYGAEFWCLTERLFSMLRIFHHRCVRSLCRISLTQYYNFRKSH